MKRWLLWNAACLRGRRCADVVFSGVVAPTGPPPGTVVKMEYTCSCCGTRYQRQALIESDGAYTQWSRERIR